MTAADGNSDRDKRELAIVVFFLDTGIRRANLAGISLVDLNLRTNRILISSATDGNQHIVSFASDCADVTRNYLERTGREDIVQNIAVIW
jgi:integrase